MHASITQLQRLRPCGCGRHAALSSGALTESDFCVTCELTLSGTADAIPNEDTVCLICQEPIISGHLSRLNCCGVDMHAGCCEEYFDKLDRCPHCRSYAG